MTVKRWTTRRETWKKLKPAARSMRNAPTPAEHLLWENLRGGRLKGLNFRRQHPPGPFIVDFYRPGIKLVIEVDGEIHQGSRKQDIEREHTLNQMGCQVIRFQNGEIIKSLDTVIGKIESAMNSLSKQEV